VGAINGANLYVIGGIGLVYVQYISGFVKAGYVKPEIPIKLDG